MVYWMKFNMRWWTILALLCLISIAVFAPLISPFDPWEMNIPYGKPDTVHWLGTNDLGQDILSELIHSCRISLFIGIVSAVVITVVGSGLGMIAGYYGGAVDRILSVLINVGMSIPSLPLTIVMVAFFKPSIWNIIIAICITEWTSTARMVRSRTLQLKKSCYVTHAKLMGASDFYTMYRHILPNMGHLIVTKGSLAVASSMLTEASLSYLGLGSPLYKSWGMMLRDAFRAGGVLNHYWWWYVPPILCISISVYTLSSFGRCLNERN